MTAQTDRLATASDVRHVLGDLDDTTINKILSSNPSLGALGEAALWARGDGDLIAREHRELSAQAEAIAEILRREDEEQSDDAS